MKRVFIILLILATGLVVVVTSCQKDDAFKSDKQIENLDTIGATSNSVAAEALPSSDIPSKNLPGPDSPPKKTRGWLGELLMVQCKYNALKIEKKNNNYEIYADIHIENFVFPDSEYQYRVEIWDYALESDWWFFTTWHKKHSATIQFEGDVPMLSGTLKQTINIPVNDFFASTGTGHRELWLYLSAKYMGIVEYKILEIQKYNESTKNIFDNWRLGKND